jgi:hypothetical protein
LNDGIEEVGLGEPVPIGSHLAMRKTFGPIANGAICWIMGGLMGKKEKTLK